MSRADVLFPAAEPGDGPIVLVVAPTRELAVQIQQECTKFGGAGGVRNTVVYGGVPRGPQMGTLRRGVEVVIATPGKKYTYMIKAVCSAELGASRTRWPAAAAGKVVSPLHSGASLLK